MVANLPDPSCLCFHLLSLDMLSTSHFNFNNNISMLSCTSYMIIYCRCPIILFSKLQTEIALSMAEYLALSKWCENFFQCTHTLMQEITKDGSMYIQLNDSDSHAITTSLEQSQVLEDNASCIILAMTDQFWPRTKHIGIKWHPLQGSSLERLCMGY